MDISGQVLSPCSCLLLHFQALPLRGGNIIRASLGSGNSRERDSDNSDDGVSADGNDSW